MEKTIRWGIVGAGNIANKFARAVKNVNGAELVAIASRTEKNGREFAARHNIENVFAGYEQMAKSSLVDAVYIATLHPMHHPCAKLFLNAGKHVLCEKPVCVNAREARELEACAKSNGVFLMEAMWTRFLPAVKEALKIAQSGEIGEIRGTHADFSYSVTKEECPSIFDNALAGGSLLDVGIYALTLASIFLGDNPEKISAVADVENGVDCATNVLLKYPSGAVASATSGINVLKPENAYIYGTKGYITLPNFYGAREIFVTTNDATRHIIKERLGEGFEEEIIEATDCIRQGKIQSDVMPMSLSIKILELMDGIRKQIGVKYPSDK